MKQLFTIENLINAVGGEDRLKLLFIDKGSNFLSGKVTSSFQGSATSVGTPDITAGIMNECSKIMNEQIQEKTIEIAKLPGEMILNEPSKIFEHQQKTFNENKTTFNKETEALIIGEDELAKQKKEEEKKKKKEERRQKIQNKLNDVNEEIVDITSDINEGINKTIKYIAEGPDFICNEINKLLNKGVTGIEKLVNTKKKNIESAHDDDCKIQGEELGNEQAEKYNQTIKDAAKKAFDTQNQNMAKAIISAFSAKQAAKLKIMGITGINLPM